MWESSHPLSSKVVCHLVSGQGLVAEELILDKLDLVKISKHVISTQECKQLCC